MTFEHEVPAETRQRSLFDPDTNCFTTPDGRAWRFTDDPRGEGVAWKDEKGHPISIAVWIPSEQTKVTITAARYAGQDPERIPNPGACLPLGKEETLALEIALETDGADLKACAIWPGFTHLLRTRDGWFYHVCLADAD